MTPLRNISKIAVFLGITLVVSACGTYRSVDHVVFKDPVDTRTKPVTSQTRRTWSFGSLHVNNLFDCARLNDLEQENDSTFIAYIRPENEPVNPSSWYAFKLTEDSSKVRYIVLDYGEEKHRYNPKLYRNGTYAEIDTSALTILSEHRVMLRLPLSYEEVILSAQRLASSANVDRWMDSLHSVYRLPYRVYGKSKEGRPLKFLKISKGKKSNPVVVLLCRQHPPEVTGWFALQYFLAGILEKTELSRDFLEKYTVLVYPLLNPDGVDGGFWRHNTGGVDLNRDWSFYRQEEIQHTVRHLFKTCRRKDVVLALDFHSTYNDVFYTNDETARPSALPAFKDAWLNALRTALPDNHFVEKNSMPQTPVSKNWFYRFFNATAITYEIGDNTPMEIIELKGRASAELMMRILTEDKAPGG